MVEPTSHSKKYLRIDSKITGTQWRLLLLGSYLLHSLFCEIMWFFPHFSYHQTQQDWTNRIDAVFSTGWFEPLWLPPCRQVSKTGWFEPLRLPPCRQVSKIICAVSCRSYCQKVLKAQVPFVFAQQKNLSSDWRSSRKQQKKVGEGNGIPTAANARREFQGLKTFEGLGIRWGRRNPGPFSEFFLLTPQKYPEISSSVMYTVPGVVHLSAWQMRLREEVLFLCSKLGLFCVFFLGGVGDVFLIQSVN